MNRPGVSGGSISRGSGRACWRRIGRCDIDGLAGVVFSGLASLVIEDVTDQEEVIAVRARTAIGLVACPRCGGLTSQVHGHYTRTVADVPADGRPVVLHAVHHGHLVQLDLLARTQRHPKAVRTSSEQQNPELNDLHFLKSQAKGSPARCGPAGWHDCARCSAGRASQPNNRAISR